MNPARFAQIPFAIQRLTQVCEVGLLAMSGGGDPYRDMRATLETDIRLMLDIIGGSDAPPAVQIVAGALPTREGCAEAKQRLEDYQRLQSWAEEQPRRPAASAFTAGPLRDAAYAVESRLTKLEAVAAAAWRLIGHTDGPPMPSYREGSHALFKALSITPI